MNLVTSTKKYRPVPTVVPRLAVAGRVFYRRSNQLRCVAGCCLLQAHDVEQQAFKGEAPRRRAAAPALPRGLRASPAQRSLGAPLGLGRGVPGPVPVPRDSCGSSALPSSSCRPFLPSLFPFPPFASPASCVPALPPPAFLPPGHCRPPTCREETPARLPRGASCRGAGRKAPRRRGAPPGWRPLAGPRAPGPGGHHPPRASPRLQPGNRARRWGRGGMREEDGEKEGARRRSSRCQCRAARQPVPGASSSRARR